MTKQWLMGTVAFSVVLGSVADCIAVDQISTTRTLDDCVLARDADGTIWIRKPLVYLGMVGVYGNAPLFRLAPEVAERFAPLANDVRAREGSQAFYDFDLPMPSDPTKPLILVRIKVTADLRRPETPPDINIQPKRSWQPAVYEVTHAELIHAEFISGTWREAWIDLGKTLAEIVEISRTAPGSEKTARLTAAVQRASMAYHTMIAATVEDDSRSIVRRIEPQARAVRLFRNRIESNSLGNWGQLLRRFTAALHIEPSPPLPDELPSCPLQKLLAESTSAADFFARVRRSWPESVLDQPLIFREEVGELVYCWQVEYLTQSEFHTLRDAAAEQISAGDLTEKPPGQPTSIHVPQWDVELKTADIETLADNGLLSAIVVDKVGPEGSAAGLLAGDLIVDYASVYDLVMGQAAFHLPLNRLVSRAAHGHGTLTVLRAGQIIELEVPEISADSL